MYPTQMRRHKIVTRALLILFIVNQVVNFVFGAPVAAREKLEWRIDVDVAEDGTAALQKRMNPVGEWSTNLGGQTPPSPDRTEVDQLRQEMGEQGLLIDSPKPQHLPWWSTPPFSEVSSTESTASSSPMPPSSPPLPASPPPLTPPPPPPPPAYSPPLTPPLPPPASPPSSTPPPPPASPPPPTPPPPPPLPASPPPPTPPPPLKEDHLLPAWSLATEIPSTTGHQPTPQQSSGLDLDVHPPPNPESRPVPNPVQPPLNPEVHPPAAAKIPIDNFLDMLMKGKIKRTFPASVL